MADNLEDEGFDLGGDSFDAAAPKKLTLGELWRDNPAFKIGVVALAAIVVFAAIVLFGGKEEAVVESTVPEGSDLTTPPGTEEANPAYIEAIREENQARTEEAYREGGSSLPTPIDPPVGKLVVANEEEDDDPLKRWRKLQEERLSREMQTTEAVDSAAVEDAAARQEAIQALSQAMAEQMRAILDSKNQIKVNFRTVTNESWLDDLHKDEEAQNDDAAASDDTGQTPKEVLLPAGQILYAQLLTEANSDVPGPVLAEIASGPFRGARILGQFKVEKELMTLQFDKLVLGEEMLAVNAVALDPDTTLPGMATDVDHHYLKRVALPMAAAFVEGLASAISESGRTDVTISGETVATETEEASNDQEVASGIEEAGQELGEILDEIADETEVTVVIATGTPIGILFVEPVVRGGETQTDEAQQQQQNGQMMFPGQMMPPGAVFLPQGFQAIQQGTTGTGTAAPAAPAQ